MYAGFPTKEGSRRERSIPIEKHFRQKMRNEKNVSADAADLHSYKKKKNSREEYLLWMVTTSFLHGKGCGNWQRST